MSIGAITRRTKNQVVIHRRDTASLFGPEDIEASAVTSVGADGKPFYIELRLKDMVDDTGTVTVSGTDSSGDRVEVEFDIDGPGRYLSTALGVKFSSITGYEQMGLAGGEITIRSVTSSGQPVQISRTLGRFNAYLTRPREGEALQSSGNVPVSSSLMIASPKVSVKNNDLLEADGVVWEVKAVSLYKDRNGKGGYLQIIVFAEGQN